MGKRTRARHADELNRGATAETVAEFRASRFITFAKSDDNLHPAKSRRAHSALSSSLVRRDSLRVSVAYSTFLPHYHLLARPVAFRISILEHRAYFISRYVRSRHTPSSFRHVFFKLSDTFLKLQKNTPRIYTCRLNAISDNTRYLVLIDSLLVISM